MIKKLLAVLFAAFMLISLCACSGNTEMDAEIKIVTTIFPQYDFARAVCAEQADKLSLEMLLPPGSESHDYSPTPEDLLKIESCDLFICVGGETDSWVEGVLDALGNTVNVMYLADYVTLLPEDETLSHGHDHSYENGEDCDSCTEHYDEHVWTSPENGAILTKAVAEELSKLFPHYEESFTFAAERYSGKLLSLKTEMEAICENAARDVLIFAERFPFKYLTEMLHLHAHAAFSGCSSDSEPSLSMIYHLTNLAKHEEVPVILELEFSKTGAGRVIAEECGARVMVLHSCHNVSKEDYEKGTTYFELMKENVSVLKAALG